MLYTAGGTTAIVVVVVALVLVLGVAEAGDEAKASGEERGPPTGFGETGELSTELSGVSVGDPLLDELTDDDSC